MALLKCTECQREISTKAKTCPGCGAPVPKLQNKIAGFVLLFFIVIIIIASCQDTKKPAKAPDTPESRAKAFRENQVLKIAKELKQTMHDPASLEFIKVTSNENSSTICMDYRARNGFGAMRAEQTLYLAGKPYQNEEAWNGSCIAKNRHDLTEVARLAL